MKEQELKKAEDDLDDFRKELDAKDQDLKSKVEEIRNCNISKTKGYQFFLGLVFIKIKYIFLLKIMKLLFPKTTILKKLKMILMIFENNSMQKIKSLKRNWKKFEIVISQKIKVINVFDF